MNEPINKSMSQSFAKLEEQLEKAMAVQTAMILFEWDNETLAPREAAERTARVIGSLSGQYLDIITGETVKKAAEAVPERGGASHTDSESCCKGSGGGA